MQQRPGMWERWKVSKYKGVQPNEIVMVMDENVQHNGQAILLEYLKWGNKLQRGSSGKNQNKEERCN